MIKGFKLHLVVSFHQFRYNVAKGAFTMLPSPKVEKHLAEIKRDQLSREELRELLKAIAQDFQIPIQVAKESEEDDFWAFSPEDEQRFHDLLGKSTDPFAKHYTRS